MANAGTAPPQPNIYTSIRSSLAGKHLPAYSPAAQSFAADLDNMFGLSNIDILSEIVEHKKANVSSGVSELESLEARLRETEQRLAKVTRGRSLSRRPAVGAMSSNTMVTGFKHASPLSQHPVYPNERPRTGQRAL